MAKGKKTGGRDWVKGKEPGPGRPRLPDDIKQARLLNRIDLERLINFYWRMPYEEAMEVYKDPKTDLLNRTAIKQAMLSSEGQLASAEWLMQRSLGKVTEQLEISVPRRTIINRPNGEQVVLGTEPTEDE